MALTTIRPMRYPEPGNTPNVPRDMEWLARDVEARLFPWFGKPYVQSGGALTNTGMAFRASAGIAVINGQAFAFDTSPDFTAAAPDIANRLWLTQTLDANGRHTGHTWSVRTDAVVPANSVLVADVWTAAGPTITGLYRTFRGVIMPGVEIARGVANSVMAGAGNFLPLEVVGDGHTPMHFQLSAYSMQAGSAGGTVQVATRNALNTSYLGSDTPTGFGGITHGHSAQANYQMPCSHDGFVPPFVGRRLYQLNVNAGGSVYADANVRAIHRVEWTL